MASLFGTDIVMNNNTVNTDITSKVSNLIEASYDYDLNALYRGKVVNTTDPLNMGRVQVRIPSIHGLDSSSSIYTPATMLPWASPGIWNAGGNDSGQFIVPPKGTMVFVTFENNNETRPVYFGGVSLQAPSESKEICDNININKGMSYSVLTDDYPTDFSNTGEVLLYKTLKGSCIYMNDKDGKESLRIVDASGQSIEMENYGLYLNRRRNNLGVSAESKLKITTNRGEELVLKNNRDDSILFLKGSKIYLENKETIKSTDTNIKVGYNTLLNQIIGEDISSYVEESGLDPIVWDSTLNEILGVGLTRFDIKHPVIYKFPKLKITNGIYLEIERIGITDGSYEFRYNLINKTSKSFNFTKLEIKLFYTAPEGSEEPSLAYYILMPSFGVPVASFSEYSFDASYITEYKLRYCTSVELIEFVP